MSSASSLVEELKSDQFSGVVEVLEAGEPILRLARGMAKRSTGEVIHPDSRFGVASITKMFTAVAMLRLVEQGSCELSEPICQVIRSLEGTFDESVTIDSLLSHRSGLGDYLDDEAHLPFAHLPVDSLRCPEDFLPLIKVVDQHEPGVFRYSSAGFVLLGLAIENLTELAFPAAIQKLVLEPAELLATDFAPVDCPHQDHAWGYLDDGQPNFEHIPPVGGPDGGIVTTARDLRRFFSWLRNSKANADSLRELLWSHCVATPGGDGDAYGRGFDLMTIHGAPWCGHTGSDPGVSARAMLARNADSSIIVLCNQGRIAFRVFRLIKEWMESDDREPLILD